MYGYSWGIVGCYKLVFLVIIDILDNIIVSNVIFIFYSRFVIKGSIIEYIVIFFIWGKGVYLFFFNNEKLSWFYYLLEFLGE